MVKFRLRLSIMVVIKLNVIIRVRVIMSVRVSIKGQG